MSKETIPADSGDPYVDRFLKSPVYLMVLRRTIDTAASSYTVARVLSIILFSIGILLLAVAVGVGIIRSEETLSLVFGGLGTANLIALLLYRPIERIQSGVDALIKSQVVCLSFMAQYDSIARTLATMGQMPLKDTNRDEQLKLAKYIRESASRLIADLNQQTPTRHSQEPDSESKEKS